MTKTEFINTKQSIETKIKYSFWGSAALAFVVIALYSLADVENLIPDNLKFLAISFVLAATVIAQVLGLRRIRKLNQSFSLICHSCKLTLTAEQLTNIVEDSTCPSCGNAFFSPPDS